MLLEGNPLHELTTTSMAKRPEEKRDTVLGTPTKNAGGERKTKVYTIGLLNEAGIGAAPSLSVLGYSRSVRMVAIMLQKGNPSSSGA